MHISIISASVREGRISNRVALYLKTFIEERNLATVEIIDLLHYQFPIFTERLKHLKELPQGAEEFADKINNANGVIFVTPEYNGGYPASLKNVIDFLYDEWHRKPIAITTVSNGPFGGSQVITSLLFSLWKIRAWVVPAMLPMPKAQDLFDEQGNAINKADTDRRTNVFINELLWCMEAGKMMEMR